MPVLYHVTNLMNKSKGPSDSLLLSRKVCTEKDPRPTRHRGVLTLKVPLNVYDMQHSKSSNFAEIVAQSRGAKPIFQANKIATKRSLNVTGKSCWVSRSKTYLPNRQDCNQNTNRTDLPGFADLSILKYSTTNNQLSINRVVQE